MNRDKQFQQYARAIWQRLLAVRGGYIDVNTSDDPAEGWFSLDSDVETPGYQTVLAECLYDFAIHVTSQVVNKPNNHPQCLVDDYVSDHAEIGAMWEATERRKSDD